MRRKPCYFKKGDTVIYLIIILFFSALVKHTLGLTSQGGSKAEIYVDNQLKYVYSLHEEPKDYFVDTVLGGVNVRIENMKIRVTSSNSPLKICVKQGWISNTGDTIIGVPDRLLIKITGESNYEEGLDGVAR